MAKTGFSNGVMFAENVDFTQAALPTPQVTADGQLLIGNAVAPNIRVGTITSPSGTLTIGYAAPNITIDLAGGGIAFDEINVQATTAPGVSPVTPSAGGALTLSGARVAASAIPIQSRSIALNQLQIEVQTSSAQAVDTASANGLCHFNSGQFTVSPTGFVSLVSGTAPWLESAGGLLLVNTGYFANAAAVYTLPAAPTIGQMVEIIDNIGGGVVVTANAGQTIRISNVASSVAGTATSTQFCDALRLVYRAANTSWECCPGSAGNWNLA